MTDGVGHLLSPKQLGFIVNGNAKWNLAHGSVRSGKTVGTLFAFMNSLMTCPDSQIWMIGKTSKTIYDNAISLILNAKGDNDPLSIFRPSCSWSEYKRELLYMDKTIGTIGAKDEGSIGLIQGKTMSRVYCDEMTLYPENVIEMIDTRLSNPHSMGFASMNPSYPSHKLKQWIDKADSGDPNYYSMHFTLDDNPFLDESYKKRVKDSVSGLFYKRNYLGLWCLAEGAIFDFFDRNTYVWKYQPKACAEYYVAGVDYGTSNAFACVIVGVSTGKANQTGKMLWVEQEYYWDSKKTHRQKTNSEYAEDVEKLLEPYGVRIVYIDPSAASFRAELRKRNIHTVDAHNDVEDGIRIMTSEMKRGALFVMDRCTNLIREIEGYVWDSKAGERGWDEPVKKNDHAVDALRYVIASHKVQTYKPTPKDPYLEPPTPGFR
jgi:PBSX family phage terminase large subunit